MKKRVAFLFPGQGAQTVGMGKDFFERDTAAREVFQQADDLLQRSLSQLIFNGPAEVLTETRNSQTAIYVVSIALLRALERQFPELKPRVCAGLSLGEYTALTASHRLSFEKTLPLVQFRGQVMNEACEQTKGTMAALFGLSADDVDVLVRALNLPNDLWVANYNCPGQTVISGTLKGIEAGIKAAQEKGAKRAIPLKVHGAFHSGLMRLAEEKLAAELERIDFVESKTPLVMNVPGDFVTDPESMRHFLIRQVSSSVRWEQGIRKMMPEIDLFVEIGPGKILAGLNNQIGMIPTVTVNKIEDFEKLAQAIIS